MAKKAKSKGKNDDVEYDDEEEGEWVETKEAGDPEVEPQAVPPAALLRTTTCTPANPTPPTNVPVIYQGTPPTQSGLAGGVAPGGPAPDVTAANIFLCADPLNGAVQGPALKPDVIVAFTNAPNGATAGAVVARAAELAGRGEADGTEVVAYYAKSVAVAAGVATVIQRGTGPAYNETPNASHPSYGT